MLFRSDDVKEVIDTMENKDNPDAVSHTIDYIIDNFPYNNVTEFWGMRACEWYAHVLGEKNPLYNDLLKMSEKKTGFFLYESADDKNTTFIHIATNTPVQINNRSLIGLPKEYKDKELIALMGFVNWQDSNYVVGQVKGFDNTPEFIEELKNDEDEKKMFAEDKKEYADKQQQELIIAEDINSLKELQASQEEDYDIFVELVRNENISKDVIKECVLQDKFEDLKFAEMDDKKLLKDNIDFIIDYFK